MNKLSTWIFCLFVTNAFAADFSIRDIENDGPSCPWLDGAMCLSGVLQGVIQRGDTERIEAQISGRNAALKEKGLPSRVRLGLIQFSSVGGDVYEAMMLGEWFRRNKVQVIVPMDSPCYSACVFALAGAVMRIGSNIGLHSFYTSATRNPNFDYDVENTKYQKVEKDIRDYLQRMRMPSGILEQAIQTPSASLKVLNDDEARSLGLLVGYDPLFHQLLVSKGYLKK